MGRAFRLLGLQKIVDHLVAVREGAEVGCVSGGQKAMLLTGGRLNHAQEAAAL